MGMNNENQTPLLDQGSVASTSGRWVILVLSCVCLFGSYYVFDIPSALNSELSEYMGLSSFQFNLFYTVYSAPNCVLPLFGGFLTDRLGTSKSLLLFTCLIVIGQSLFSLGIYQANFYLCLIGRFIFGLGGESLTVANSALLAIVFSKAEVASAMAASLTIARLGSVANNNLSVLMYGRFGLNQAAFLGTFFTVLSLLCTIIMIVLDRRSRIESALEIVDISPPSEVVDHHSDGIKAALCGLPLIFWLITASLVVIYGTILPFNNVAEALLTQRDHCSTSLAVLYMSIPFTISALTSPFLGALIDRVGLRANCLTLSAMLLAIAHLILALTTITAIIPLVLIGSAYSIFAAAIWPCIAIVVNQRYLGTAFGVATAVQNIGLGGIPIIVGLLHDRYMTYMAPEILLGGLAIFGAGIGVVVIVIDRTAYGSVLNRKSIVITGDVDEPSPIISTIGRPEII